MGILNLLKPVGLSALLPFKMKILLGGSLIALGAFFLTYAHIGSLKGEIDLLEAQGKAQELVIDSYQANIEAMRKLQKKTDRIQAENRTTQATLSKSVSERKTNLKEILDASNEECLTKPLPDSILSSLRPTKNINKD